MTKNNTIKIIHDVLDVSKRFDKIKTVPFSSVVKVSSGFKVLPIDMKESGTKKFLELIRTNLDAFLKTSRVAHRRYVGKRVNEIGKTLEAEISHELRSPLKVTQLKESGYPDIEILYKKQKAYLEIKTTSVKGKSDFRSFYFTNGKKIKSDAYHLLLTISVSKKGWKIEEMTLNDLSKLNVKLKAEFNASKNAWKKDAPILFTVN